MATRRSAISSISKLADGLEQARLELARGRSDPERAHAELSARNAAVWAEIEDTWAAPRLGG